MTFHFISDDLPLSIARRRPRHGANPGRVLVQLIRHLAGRRGVTRPFSCRRALEREGKNRSRLPFASRNDSLHLDPLRLGGNRRINLGRGAASRPCSAAAATGHYLRCIMSMKVTGLLIPSLQAHDLRCMTCIEHESPPSLPHEQMPFGAASR